MGADIHGPWVEQRSHRADDDGNYRWRCVAEMHVGRNYRLFALMAEVRKDWPLGIVPNEKVIDVLKAHNVTCDEDFEKLSENEKRTMIKEAHDNGITLGQESFEPRGVPKDISSRTVSAYTLFIVDDEDGSNEEGCCKRSSAEGWLKSKCSEVWRADEEGKAVVVTNPDWHSGSWLSTSEVRELVARFQAAQESEISRSRKEMERMKADFEAHITKMKALGEPEEKITKAMVRASQLCAWSSFDPMGDSELLQMKGLLALMESLETPEKPCRIVFFFDN
jgi:hypothetical protein